ncbi:MAG: tetratricopeptide repeat protein [Pseudobdellovibrionaceae bacterium]
MRTLTIFKQMAGVLVVSMSVNLAAANSSAEDRLSVQNWSEKNIKNPLVYFDGLDKKLFSTCDDCDNKIKMQTARKLYAKGKYDEARALYDQISKGSPYWLEAVEEKAWTYFRQDQLESALAQAKTLLAPQFASYVGSESYFLQSLTQLKSCNYKGVFETNRLFKEKQKVHLAEIQTLSKTGTNEALKNMMNEADNFPMRFSDVGENAPHLPQLFFKDVEFQRQLMRYKISEKALNTLKLDGGSLDLQSSFEKVKATSASLLQKRIKELAVQETNDNFKIVQKLNLVEIEAIQRLHADLDLDKNSFKKGPFNNTTSDQLVFVDDGRPWIDELDKYEVRTKTCTPNLRRKM